MPDPTTAAESRARGHRRAGRWTLLAAATVVALALAETGLRLVGPPPARFEFLSDVLRDGEKFVADPELFWRLNPGGPETNRLGLRGWLPAREKHASALRIACVGDSCTYGAGVRYEETYGLVLERMLRDAMPDRPIETILAGLPGYSTFQNRILFERHVASFAPDVTILYCGGWNDYVPAIGLADRERAELGSGLGSSLRLVQLVRGALGGAGPSEADRERYETEFRNGRAPDGRRVPIDAFRANLRAIADAATHAGGRVIVVIPPLAEETFAKLPIAAEYRSAVRELARERGLAIVDAPALFRAERARAPIEWRARVGYEWPCLIDWVHPSTYGHEVLAEALFAVLRRDGLVADAASRRASGPSLDGVEPAQIDALAGGSLEVRGSGLARPGACERAFIGPWWIPRVDVVDDDLLRLTVPRAIRPGRYPVSVLGSAGTRTSGARILVRPPGLTAEADTRPDGLHVRVGCAAPPGWQVAVWFASGLREVPASTRFGAFALAATPDGRPGELDDRPFAFEALELLRLDGTSDASGRFDHEFTIDPATAAQLPAIVYLQAALGTRGYGILTGAVRLELPR